MSRANSFCRSYGNRGSVLSKETNQTSTPLPPPSNAYRQGTCANQTSQCNDEVAPTQLDEGGPAFPLCRHCNSEPAVYRSDYRGATIDTEDSTDDDFRLAVERAFRRTVPAEVRGPRYFYAPRVRGAMGGR